MFNKSFILILHALIGWAVCAAIIGIGFQFTSKENTLIIHAVGAPIVFGLLSWNYFRKYHYTSPLLAACIFLGLAVILDFFLVAMVIQKSFIMFRSALGTWIPFLLIFLSTYIVGQLFRRRSCRAMR